MTAALRRRKPEVSLLVEKGGIFAIAGLAATLTWPYIFAVKTDTARSGCRYVDLLDGDRFRQVARLVHVAAAAHRDVIGQQLQRNDFENRRQQFERGRNSITWSEASRAR